MGTEIATTEQQDRKVQVHPGGKSAAFVPQSLDEMWRISQVMANSGMTPKAYGNDPNRAMVGIMAGAEVGLTPFAALQSIAVIGNNPSLWGDGALAVVMASGLLEDIEETDDGETATCRLVRKGRKSEIVRTFSMEDARKAGLAGKSGPWTQYPARMRQMRARAFALRDGFADVLKGLQIAEEVRDFTPIEDDAPRQKRLSGEMLVEQSKPQPLTKESLEEELDDEIPKFDRKAEEAEAEVANEHAGQGAERAAADQTLRDIDGPIEETSGAGQPADETDGEAEDERLSALRERLAEAKTKQDVTPIEADWLKIRASYDDDCAIEFDGHIAARMKALPNKGESDA